MHKPEDRLAPLYGGRAACSSFGRSSLPETFGSGNANDLNVFKTAVWDQGLGVRGTLEVLGAEIDEIAPQPLPVCLETQLGPQI